MERPPPASGCFVRNGRNPNQSLSASKKKRTQLILGARMYIAVEYLAYLILTIVLGALLFVASATALSLIHI